MTDRPEWIDERCLRCVACVGSCPVGALKLSRWRIRIDREACTECGRCVRICPVDALGGEGDE